MEEAGVQSSPAWVLGPRRSSESGSWSWGICSRSSPAWVMRPGPGLWIRALPSFGRCVWSGKGGKEGPILSLALSYPCRPPGQVRGGDRENKHCQSSLNLSDRVSTSPPLPLPLPLHPPILFHQLSQKRRQESPEQCRQSPTSTVMRNRLFFILFFKFTLI